MPETIRIHLPDTTVGALADKVFLHAENTGELLNAGGDALSQVENSLYEFTLAEARSGNYRASVRTSGGAEIWYGWLAATETMIRDVLPSSVGVGGPHMISVTVEDEDENPLQNAIVTVRDASTSEIIDQQTTDSAGQTGLFCETLTVKVTAHKAGYVSETWVVAVSGNVSHTFTLAAISPTPPADPNLSIVTVLCLDEYGQPEEGVEVTAQLVTEPVGAVGYAYDARKQEAISDQNGIATLTVIRNATYQYRRGKGGWFRNIIVTTPTALIKAIIGVDE